jgi:hypothetical protein
MNMVQPGTRILVADSDRAVLEMLQIRLDLAGYHALAARSGPAALEMAHNMRPALMVLDLAITEMSAFDVMAALQRDVSHPVRTSPAGRQAAGGRGGQARGQPWRPGLHAQAVQRRRPGRARGQDAEAGSPERPPVNAFGSPERPLAARPSPSSDVFI